MRHSHYTAGGRLVVGEVGIRYLRRAVFANDVSRAWISRKTQYFELGQLVLQ